jgi:signal transduction histidine kinase
LDERAVNDRQERRPAEGLRLAWPLAALVLFAMALLASSLWLGSRRLDESAREAERRIVAAQLHARLAALGRLVGDYGWWDEAYQKLSPVVDRAWADSNIGPYLFDVQHVDLALVVTPEGHTLFASDEGKEDADGADHAFGPSLVALVARASGRSDRGVSPALAFLRAGRVIYAASASPILPNDKAGPPVPDGGANRLVFAQRLDEHFLGDLAGSYEILDPSLADRPPTDGPSVALPGPDGSAVGYLGWRAHNPGATLRIWATPALVAASAVMAVFAWLGILNMRRMAALQVAHEAALRRSDERERLERMEHSFVSNVSHELRTPLTAIAGALGLVSAASADELPEKTRRLVEIAHRNSTRLVRLVDDILDIERLEAGLAQMELRAVDLRQLVEQSVEINQPYAARTATHLELIDAPDRPEVLADGDRLHQVLTNLIGNAAKFSPPGSVVRLAVEQLGDRARVEVIDQGPGVPAAFRSRLFQRFSRASDEVTRHVGGSGLGLYIARTIVELQGGRIGVDSPPSEGATFWFEIPLVPSGATGLSMAGGEKA